MIQIDSRVGSKELINLFPKGKAHLTHLTFGDFSFVGNGPGGMPLNIGIERKTIREVAGELSAGRLVGHQIPGLLATYQVVYLVVEGRWRGDPRNGILQTRGYNKRGGAYWADVENGATRFVASAIRKYLVTLETMAGLHLRFTEDKKGTAEEVEALHSWWVGKEWDEHRAHMAIQYPPVDIIMFRKPTVMEFMAACLPGIGWKRSKAVAAHFPSITDMLMASEKEWGQVEGIGKGIAHKITEVLQFRKEVR